MLALSNYEARKAFFTSALAPRSISLLTETHGWAGFGKDGKPEFWVGQGATAHAPMHIAFLAANREQVRAFQCKPHKAERRPPVVLPVYRWSDHQVDSAA